jgi:hypothetical protein
LDTLDAGLLDEPITHEGIDFINDLAGTVVSYCPGPGIFLLFDYLGCNFNAIELLIPSSPIIFLGSYEPGPTTGGLAFLSWKSLILCALPIL